jgi:hypothetical protein
MSHAHVTNDDEDELRAAAAEELEEFKKGVQNEIKAKENLNKEAEVKKQAEEKEKHRLSLQNKYDGLIHHENGEKHFFDGGVVGGVNNYLRTHAKLNKHHRHLGQ